MSIMKRMPNPRTLRFCAASALALLLLACGGEADPGDPDAGQVDVDAGFADAGDVVDAGPRDSGATAMDSGVEADAGVVELPLGVGLLSVDELVAALGAPSVQVVDVRGAAAFAAGHVPGAVHLPTGGLRGTVDGVPSQVVARAAAATIFEAAGVDATAHLVVVGPANDTTTSRALWTLALYGATRGLSLLDGGFAAWTAAGQATDTEVSASPAAWAGDPTVEALRVDKDWLLAHLDDDDVAIFDVRTPGEFAAGHIPGAVSANWTENLDRGGLFIDLAAIRARHGDPTAATLVVYCQSGARASVGWAVLRAAGYEDVRLYDGSWNEWGNDPATPKETGS